MITAMANLITADVEAAAAFHRNHLGYVEILRVPSESPEHIVLRLGPSVLAVSSPDTLRESGLDAQPGNTVELVVFCDDVAAEVERLRTRNVSIRREAFRHPSGHQRAYVDDPDGRPIALVDAPAH